MAKAFNENEADILKQGIDMMLDSVPDPELTDGLERLRDELEGDYIAINWQNLISEVLDYVSAFIDRHDDRFDDYKSLKKKCNDGSLFKKPYAKSASYRLTPDEEDLLLKGKDMMVDMGLDPEATSELISFGAAIGEQRGYISVAWKRVAREVIDFLDSFTDDGTEEYDTLMNLKHKFKTGDMFKESMKFGDKENDFLHGRMEAEKGWGRYEDGGVYYDDDYDTIETILDKLESHEDLEENEIDFIRSYLEKEKQWGEDAYRPEELGMMDNMLGQMDESSRRVSKFFRESQDWSDSIQIGEEAPLKLMDGDIYYLADDGTVSMISRRFIQGVAGSVDRAKQQIEDYLNDQIDAGYLGQPAMDMSLLLNFASAVACAPASVRRNMGR